MLRRNDPLVQVYQGDGRRTRPLRRSSSTPRRSATSLQERVHRVAQLASSSALDHLQDAVAGPRDHRRRRALRRPVRHGLGHHELVPGHRRLEQHQPRGRRARHRRGAVRHGARPRRRHSGGDLLQPHQRRHRRATANVSTAFIGVFEVELSRQLSQEEESAMAFALRKHDSEFDVSADRRHQRDAARRRHAGAAHRLHGRRAA